MRRLDGRFEEQGWVLRIASGSVIAYHGLWEFFEVKWLAKRCVYLQATLSRS